MVAGADPHARGRLRWFNETPTSHRTSPFGGGVTVPLIDHQRRSHILYYVNCLRFLASEALGQMRPLAFAAAFKLHDMIVEWILAANGIREWRFKAKLASYDRLRQSGTLAEPPFLAGAPDLGRAFWETYRLFEEFRGVVIHAGGVAVRTDGAIEVRKQGKTLMLTDEEQASYIRALCLICKAFAGHAFLNEHLSAVVESEFSALSKHHGQSLATSKCRLTTLTIRVPRSQLLSETPLIVRIDFDHARRTVERVHPVGPNGRVFFPVTIFAETSQGDAVWRIQVDAVPTGVVELQEGDSHFDGLLLLRPPPSTTP